MSSPELRELRRISKILLLANASAVERELSKLATTDERKRMWVLTDGKRMQKDIATDAKVTQAAVSYFLSAGVSAQLIEYEHGKPPRRILDYVPPSWLELLRLPVLEEEVVESQTQTILDSRASDQNREETDKNG